MYAKCNSLQCAQNAFSELPNKNTHSFNAMISVFTQFGFFSNARDLFDEMPNPNLVSYNSMISGLTRNGYCKDAIDVFKRMQCNGMLIDKYTVVGTATACASLGALELLRQLHSAVVVLGLELNVIMCNAMIDAYGKCGDPDTAFGIFCRMCERDVVSWTSMVVGYVWSSRIERACWLFDMMPVKNAVSWSALIAGMAQNGHGDKALDIFVQMQVEGLLPTPSTFVSVLSACADLALIERGKQLHGHIIRSDSLNVFMFNALIDMYAKCGDMKSAGLLFEEMPEKDTISWNTLITGFAQNGYGKESLGYFQKMIELGFPTNHVTFLGVLSACSHMGFVFEGHRVFHLMEEHGVRPRSDHYALLIDLYGRNNKLEEALTLIQKAPVGSDQIGMWGALLGGCRLHEDLDIARRAAEALLKLEPANSGRYIMLSNIYAAAGKWHDARQVRRLLKESGLRKEEAYSWLEVRNARHGFVAKDKSHAQTVEIYDMVAKLAKHMGEAGYQPYNMDLFYPGEVACSYNQ
ncbi:Pentatricopeptide repeat-containing protein [Thalictrum thalictroides]|uniref:Pentatricopeptide repeat-containing protein n=1 Tax=Thalictrum thalictroides TaxID=46969 RepID=A0A7J6WFU1_THATH|nr:Pentatricopeptide repeat-containing protein [Thalictrum thalictroides]